jgi:photosystem II stability/assembly factor-like uncharacterized protein
MAAKNTVACWLLPILVAGLGCSSSSNPAPTSTGDGGGGGGGGGGTKDGGTPSKTPPDPPVGWRAVVGTLGTFIQTFDETSWQTRTLGTHDLEAVACVGNLIGWATGPSGIVMHTEDGGRSWSPQDPGLARPLHAVRFGRLDLGAVAGDGGALAVTRNAGATWSTVTTSPPSTATLRGVAVAGVRKLVVVVGDGGTILRSLDDGATFQILTGLAGPEDLRGVAVDPIAQLVLIASASGTIWASTDGGTSFHREATATRPLHAVALHDYGTRALAVGDDGVVMQRSVNGSWTTLPSGTHESLRAALVPYDGGGIDYVAGTHGTLLARPPGSTALVPIATGTTSDLLGLDDL